MLNAACCLNQKQLISHILFFIFNQQQAQNPHKHQALFFRMLCFILYFLYFDLLPHKLQESDLSPISSFRFSPSKQPLSEDFANIEAKCFSSFIPRLESSRVVLLKSSVTIHAVPVLWQAGAHSRVQTSIDKSTDASSVNWHSFC